MICFVQFLLVIISLSDLSEYFSYFSLVLLLLLLLLLLFKFFFLWLLAYLFFLLTSGFLSFYFLVAVAVEVDNPNQVQYRFQKWKMVIWSLVTVDSVVFKTIAEVLLEFWRRNRTSCWTVEQCQIWQLLMFWRHINAAVVENWPKLLERFGDFSRTLRNNAKVLVEKEKKTWEKNYWDEITDETDWDWTSELDWKN